MRIYVYTSGHGFGHASRDVELINAIAERRPDARFVVRTTVAPALFAWARAAVEVQRLETDTGLVQIDSLRFDEDASLSHARQFYDDFERRTDAESLVIKAAGVDLVIGDIPPLAFAAAARAGVPSVAIGNFTWDWIYEGYPSFVRDAAPVLDTIRAAYRTAGRAIRLPFHGGFQPMADVTTDVPLVARRSRRDRLETRRLLGVSDDRTLVLTSFGAYGAPIPTLAPGDARRFVTLTVNGTPPHGLAYQDIVSAADVVISKPGYGIVSECIANDTALVYTSRGRFVEYDLFVSEMPRALRCEYLSQEDLMAGRWDAAIDAVLAKPAPPERWRVDGADIAADEIISQ